MIQKKKKKECNELEKIINFKAPEEIRIKGVENRILQSFFNIRICHLANGVSYSINAARNISSKNVITFAILAAIHMPLSYGVRTAHTFCRIFGIERNIQIAEYHDTHIIERIIRPNKRATV